MLPAKSLEQSECSGLLKIKSLPEKAQHGVISLTVGSTKRTLCLVLILILYLLFTFYRKSWLLCSL